VTCQDLTNIEQSLAAYCPKLACDHQNRHEFCFCHIFIRKGSWKCTFIPK